MRVKDIIVLYLRYVKTWKQILSFLPRRLLKISNSGFPAQKKSRAKNWFPSFLNTTMHFSLGAKGLKIRKQIIAIK